MSIMCSGKGYLLCKLEARVLILAEVEFGLVPMKIVT